MHIYSLLKRQFSDRIFSNISQVHSIKLDTSLNIWSPHIPLRIHETQGYGFLMDR